MSKKVQVQSTQSYSNSIFRLTFVVEVKGVDVFHDCNEGMLDLEPSCSMFLKLQYQLYVGQNYDIDVLVWPHVAKVVCGQQHVWVRCWQLLERRFLAFSISHIFPVRVQQLKDFVATVTPTYGSAQGGKGEEPTEVYLPPLKFGDLRYFAPVIDDFKTEPFKVYLWNLIWEKVIDFIPKSILDDVFDTPLRVSNGRHQDAVLYHVKESILNTSLMQEIAGAAKNAAKYGLFLSGQEILSGIGRITPFRQIGHATGGKVFAFIGTEELPANDDFPIIFVNIESLHNIPLKIFKDRGITHVYTSWCLGETVHNSSRQEINTNESKDTVTFEDHYALPMEKNANQIVTNFLDDPFEIEIRGIRNPEIASEFMEPKFFGYGKTDKNFASNVAPKQKKIELDVPIAVTKINARQLGKGLNDFMRGDYPLFSPKLNEYRNHREDICTNDINGIGIVQSKYVIPSSVILEYQMSLEVSMGLVGCKPRPVRNCYTRLYIIDSSSHSSMNILRTIFQLNEEVAGTGPNDDFLSGFAIDTGDVIIFYIEGPRDGQILKIVEITPNYSFKVKPLFSTFAKYTSRVYPEFMRVIPFVILKMYVPLTLILACPPVYVRPTLPLPAKSAALKLGRLIASKLALSPCRSDLPTAKELQSFRLELCTPPRPPIVPALRENIDKASQLKPGWPLNTAQYPEEDDKCKRSSIHPTVNWTDKDN